MGIFESLSELLSFDVRAEEPAQEDNDEQQSAGDDSEAKDNDDEGDDGAGEDGEDDEEGDDEDEDDDEEEEEEEPEDPMPKIHEDCARTPGCAHAKHEYDACTERVTKWQDADEEEREKLGPKEDCVEEFFEYTHCISQCAAPKLFKQLK